MEIDYNKVEEEAAKKLADKFMAKVYRIDNTSDSEFTNQSMNKEYGNRKYRRAMKKRKKR